MTSPTSMNWFKVALVLCLLQRRASYESRYNKSAELNRSTVYGFWSFTPRQVQTCFPWHVNTCGETRFQLITQTTSNTSNDDIILDCQIKTCDGWVAGVDFLWASNDKRAVLAMTLPKKDINDLHIELGHPSEAITWSTAKALGIEVTGMFKSCEDCALGKAKQCTVSKKAVPLLQVWGERLFFDISSPSTPTFGRKHHCLLVIDDCSNYSWSFFLKEKSDLAETMLGFVNNLNIKVNLQVQYLHRNNAGKNQAFERTCKQEGLGIDFEYTAPDMPQQNGHIKHKFATLFNWVHAMLNCGKFTTYQ